MPHYSGHAGTILKDDVIVGAVAEWTLHVHRGDTGSMRWMGWLTWQWFHAYDGHPEADQFHLELNDGSKMPSFQLSGRTLFVDIDVPTRRIEFRGSGDLDGLPDPSPHQSEIAIE